jgi:hypothetical protein
MVLKSSRMVYMPGCVRCQTQVRAACIDLVCKAGVRCSDCFSKSKKKVHALHQPRMQDEGDQHRSEEEEAALRDMHY